MTRDPRQDKLRDFRNADRRGHRRLCRKRERLIYGEERCK
jgi:hypothetical protein